MQLDELPPGSKVKTNSMLTDTIDIRARTIANSNSTSRGGRNIDTICAGRHNYNETKFRSDFGTECLCREFNCGGHDNRGIFEATGEVRRVGPSVNFPG